MKFAEKENSMTTTVRIPMPIVHWMRMNDVKLRGLVIAGHKYLNGAPDAAQLTHQIAGLKSDVRRLQSKAEIAYYVFKYHPEVYNEARIAVFDKESA